MAVEGGSVIDISLTADADLSAKQFRFVKMSSDGQVAVAAAATDNILGVLQDTDADAAGKACAVRVAGETKLVAGGTIDEGQYLTSDANGDAVATTTDKERIGAIALEAASDNDIFRALIVHFTLSAA